MLKNLMEEYLNEAKKVKAAFGQSEGFNYAVKIDSLGNDNEYFKLPFGRQIEYRKILQDFKKSAKIGHVGAKGKPTMTAVKKWVKENNPSEFWAKWKKDSSSYKDDTVEIHYKK